MATSEVSSRSVTWAEQVTLGVERGRVEVTERRGHHPVSFALHAEHGVLGPLLQVGVPRHAGTGGESGPSNRSHRLPDPVLPTYSLYSG